MSKANAGTPASRQDSGGKESAGGKIPKSMKAKPKPSKLSKKSR